MDAMRNTRSDVYEMLLIDEVCAQDPEIRAMAMFLPPIMHKMNVISNKSMMYGASAVLGQIGKLKVKYPDGFYIIPSSVHEVIVVPKIDGMSVEDVTEMVGIVNTTKLEPEQVLSSKAYEF